MLEFLLHILKYIIMIKNQVFALRDKPISAQLLTVDDEVCGC